MKLGPVTKLDALNKICLKNFDDEIMLGNCDVTIVFPIHGLFGAIQKPDSGDTVCKTYIFIDRNLLYYKNQKQN